MSSISKIQLKIKDTLEKFESLRNVDDHLLQVENQIKNIYSNLKILDKKLDKELKDIEDLEKIGVKSLFLKTLGNKEKQLEKERQEYLEVSLKYKEQKQSVELLEFERDVLKKKINKLPAIQKELERLKELRKKEILTNKSSMEYQEFSEVLHLSDVSIMLNKEFSEAIEEGKKSMKLLSQIGKYLRNATDWGAWHVYGGNRNRRGGPMPRHAVDKAVKAMTAAQVQLNNFTRELKDLGDNNIEFKLDMSHFNKFSNFFFDNLISDWIIQQRIRSTLSSIDSTYAHVHRLVLSIENEMKANQKKLKTLKTKIDQFLLS